MTDAAASTQGPGAPDGLSPPVLRRRVLSWPVWTVLRRWWPVLRWVLALGCLLLTLDVLAAHRGELTGIDTVFDHMRWFWLVPAALAEMASVLAFVVVQNRLLSAAGLRPRLRPLTGVTVASQAITSSLPGGTAVAAVYGFRWYRRFGADDAIAGWALVGTSVSAALSLAVLASVGLIVSTEEGASLDLVPAVVGALVVTAGVGVLFVYERPLVWATRAAVGASKRLIGRPRGPGEPWIERIVERAAVVRLSTRQAGSLLGWAVLNWLFDCTCFGIAFLATGSGIPWKGLLLAYGAGQLAANLPITPGGLGAVEGSITIALAYFGGGTTADISAVLVYRLISFWLVLIIGWVAWGLLAWGIRRGRWVRHARETPVAGPVGPPGPRPRTALAFHLAPERHRPPDDPRARVNGAAVAAADAQRDGGEGR